MKDADGSDGVQLCVLGGLAVTVAGRPVDLGGFRQRVLLAALAVAFPHEVSADRLLEQVWHDVDDPAMSSLHFAVSKLRDRLSPSRARGTEGVIVRRGTCYSLDTDRVRIDAVRFADLIDAADRRRDEDDDEGAILGYREALALVRGAPYADVADVEFVAVEAARLAGLELRARKALAEVLLDGGRAGEAIGFAEALASTHPLDESVSELLVIALYRVGRQSDALATLRRLRRRLDEELGVEPGVRLREVESAVLRHDDERLHARLRVTTVSTNAAAARIVTSNLPVPRTQLVGRRAEIAAIGAGWSGSQLLTLVGPGGVGKTRLAIETCRRMVTEDGPWWVDLAAVESDELVSATVAAALDLRGPGTVEHLVSVLADRRCAIVLDNCEHLLDGVARLVAAILTGCPQIRILATSREPLGVDGERIEEVAPLDEDTAVQLFAVRAAGVVPGWALGEGVVEPVRRICRELDGIPLGVELAAAQLRVLSEDQIADGLADRFVLLAGGPRDAPTRQRRLVDTIDWSYRLLGEIEARLLREVAVFAGSFDIEGAAAVHDAATTMGVLEPLTGLVRRSLLRVQPSSSPRRYRMLQTIKQFALSRCEDAERDRIRLAHRRYVLDRSVAASAHLRDLRAARTLTALEADIAEQRSAIASALEIGDFGYVLELAAALYWYWYRRGHISEGLEAITAALRGVEAGAPPPDDMTLSRALTGLGGLHYLAGDPRSGAAATARSAALATRADDAGSAAWMNAWNAYLRAVGGQSVMPLEDIRASVEQLRCGGQPWQQAEALMIEGMIRRFLGDPAAAQRALREAVSVAERCGHGWAVSSASWTLMRSAMETGDPSSAADALVTMHTVLESEGDLTSWLVLVHTAAAFAAWVGRRADGARLVGAGRALGGRIGFLPEVMDPTDAPAETAIVRDALPEDDYTENLRLGALMSRAEVNSLLWQLAEDPATRSPRPPPAPTGQSTSSS